MKMTANGSASIFITLLMVAPLAGCRGDIGDQMETPGGDGITDPGVMPVVGKDLNNMPTTKTCAPNAGRSPLRRLNRIEYRNTVRDLLPTAAAKIDTTVNTFPLDEEKLGFSNNADALTVTGLLAEGYISAAETFATEATTAANLKTTLGCDPATGDTCAQAFIANFGRRAFRRPLTTEETAHYTAIYTEGKKDTFDQAIELVIEAFLDSPYFLYRPEKGTPRRSPRPRS